jgi:peptide/nickel transport system ATP-binding protein
LTDGTIFEARHITKYFPVSGRLSMGRRQVVHAVDDISFSIEKRQTFCLVGETGSGKTTVGMIAARLLDPTSGNILFNGEDITQLSGRKLKRVRSKIQVVFQDPTTALNPRKRISQIVGLPLQIFQKMSKPERQSRVVELLEMVGLSPGSSFLERRPNELSGGQRQRVAIARAIATSPQLIIADEPTSALDASVRAQILNLLRDLQENLGVSYLLVQHDLASAIYFSDVIAVLYLGRIVEMASSLDLFESPQHPYTQALLSASPSLAREVKEKVEVMGELPSPINLPPGCRFHTRCPFMKDRCQSEEPLLREISNGHWVACHFPASERSISKVREPSA